MVVRWILDPQNITIRNRGTIDSLTMHNIELYTDNEDSFIFWGNNFCGLRETCILWIFDFMVLSMSAYKPLENL